MRSGETLLWMCAAASPVAMVYGDRLRKVPGLVSGLLGAKRAAKSNRRDPEAEPATAVAPPGEQANELVEAAAAECLVEGSDPRSLVDEMLSQNRYALLLRPQLVANLSPEQVARARTAMSEGMCLVPAGDVIVHRTTGPPETRDDSGARQQVPLRIDGYYLDRYQVTNVEYYQFVKHGGYEQMAIWDPEVLPAVLDFVDQTGLPGPRFWRNGRYPRGEDHFPVVGVCWYEAAAYARWVGKRLPTDAEWVKAGAWPVAIAGHPLLQRRYPWGEAVDRTRANLWGSGPGRTVPVDEFAGGVSVGGVQQLIGNVWEWTVDPLAIETDDDVLADFSGGNMRSLRGGAFDTYLDSQATCHFQSGDDVLARKHNIGFRCAIGLCDLASLNAEPEPQVTGTDESLVETHA